MASTRSTNNETIRLKPFEPDRYRFWVASALATLKIHNCHNIITNQEQRPVQLPDDDPAAAAFHQAASDWDYRHAQAREALLNAVPRQSPSQHLSVRICT